MDIIGSEVVTYWQRIIATLHQRNLLRDRPQQGDKVLPEADAILLSDRVIFALDLQRLGGIPREQWLDHALWAQWRAALQGRRCFVSDGGGLAICVAREPGQHVKRLPSLIPLTIEHVPEPPLTVTLGYSKRGPVQLDLAGTHRAILVGGTSGGGKTNLMQSVILQLVAKHSPDELQVAIVDTKEVDFGRDFEWLPHLFAPATGLGKSLIAHDLKEAARLIESVESERLRRQAAMAQAGIAAWRKDEGLPLLLLVVDEAAGFARTPAMKTLVEVARKGRAFGVSVIVGTQHPSAKVIDAQIKANLPTAIAFQTRTDVESRVILGKSGAEKLNRPGLALTFIGRRWEQVQTLRVDPDIIQTLISDHVVMEHPAFSKVETSLVQYAVEKLNGAFIVNRLYEAHKGGISKRALTTLAQQWEARGWLTTPAHATDPRRVTPDLQALVLPGPEVQVDDRVTGVTGGDRVLETATGMVTERMRSTYQPYQPYQMEVS
jgi:hypothetical protein